MAIAQLLVIAFLFDALLLTYANTHCTTLVLQGNGEKKILTVNGQLKGPTIKARKGDTIIVNFHNRGENNITIYWHGELNSKVITQGKIQEDEEFTYMIEVNKEEMSVWWQAISDEASIYGAIVVRPKVKALTTFTPQEVYQGTRVVLEKRKDNPRQANEDLEDGDPNSFDGFTINSVPGNLNLCSKAAKKEVGFYEIKKGNFSVKVTNWGATIASVVLPDSKGNLDDVVLGYDTLAPYVKNPAYFGALVGRVANRISGAQFTLNGKVYKLPANDGNNTLHGGHRGFSHVIWTVKQKVDGEFPYITLYYHSFDGEQGFPGALDVYVTYKISGPYEFTVTMRAKSVNKATPVNLAQHSYWNLGGQSSGPILSETVQIFASKITPVDDNLIPTGQISSVKGTPYDFLTPKTVGSQIGGLNGGYDINYVLDGPYDSRGLRKVAMVKDGRSGRGLQLWTNQPGVQFYTANSLGVVGKGGFVYEAHDALCLETQGFPDSVNHPNFPSQIVNPGQEYKHDMLFKFSF